jgi:SET and MYND domain-containing protein
MNLTETQLIPNAGRGVIALQPLPSGTVILQSRSPAYHVIFAKYRKETCAFCFLWDRGRSLPVRDGETGKVFCRVECQADWIREQGSIGVEAWKCLAAFVKAKGKGTGADQSMADGARPEVEEIEAAWREAEESGEMVRRGRDVEALITKAERKRGQAVLRKCLELVDADMLSYFLCGVLLHHSGSPLVDEVAELAMDDRPYRTEHDLHVGCNSYLQLLSILPNELLPTLTSRLCRSMVQADNHNAFGIRGGGEDSEEYMGYGVYPSASYFNHSCRPNLTKKRIERSWEFATARDIDAGEECCITYLGGDEKDLGRAERQSRLKGVWGFDCACERCGQEAVT